MEGNTSPIERTPNANKSTGFLDDEYYGPLIESYVNSILKSGLLLDEDLEVLLSVSKFRNLPEQSKYRPPLSLLSGFISIAASSYIARKYQLPLVVVPSVIMTGTVIISEFRNVKRRQSNIQIINKLIEIIVKVHKLNIGIIRYMKTRVDLEKKDQDIVTLSNPTLQDFLSTLERNNSVFDFLMENLKNISVHSVELFDDYKSLEHLTPLNILDEENINNIENCLAFTQRIQDLHVLFASKLLSYIGIGLHSKSSNFTEEDVNNLINEKLPKIVNYLQQHYDFVKKQFVSLRQSVRKKAEYKLQATTAGKKQISGKLQETLVYSVNNLSIILAKSQNVLDRIESGDENVSNAIVDLKNHTYATYESLDLLCKLYGILSNSTSGKPSESKATRTEIIDKALEEALPKVNYDDDTEPLEEKFELYVGEDDAANERPAATYDEDQSGAYLSLMLQELKQSLKQHQRFIDAKNRRGSEDDDTEVPVAKPRKSPPKFDLKVLKDERKQENNPEPSYMVNKESPVVPLQVPMPPPPPLPSFSLTNLEEEPGLVNARSMLDNIKALSNQRNVQEEVFGDSDADSNCSD